MMHMAGSSGNRMSLVLRIYVAEDVAVELIEVGGALNYQRQIPGLDSVEEPLKALGVIRIKLTVCGQILEPVLRCDLQASSNRRHSFRRKRYRYSFQDVNHAQEPVRRYVLDQIIGMADHDLARKPR